MTDLEALTEIRRRLAALQKRTNDDAFLVIEDRMTKKFVQFGGGGGGDCWVDVPSQTISEAEYPRAISQFRKYDTAGEMRLDLDRLGPARPRKEFQLNLTIPSLDRAAQFVVEFFRAVYLVEGELRLGYEEN